MAEQPKPDQRVPRRRSVTRERILDAAETAFLEKGFSGAYVESIAAAAGYTTGAIYSNFKDKDGLFLAVSERRFTKIYLDRSDEVKQARTSADVATILAKIAVEQDETYYLWGSTALEFAAYSMRNPHVH